jgi:hypothetical protein
MHIQIVARPDEPRSVRYAAKVDSNRQYLGASPDEALGYAIRDELLIRGTHMKNGDLLLDAPLRVTLLQERPTDG